MALPIYLNKTDTYEDYEYEAYKAKRNKESLKSLPKTSDQTKIIIKGQVNGIAKLAIPYIAAPSKNATAATLPMPVALSTNLCIIASVEPAVNSSLKIILQKSIDQGMDINEIDKTIDKTVVSTKSFASIIYDYFHQIISQSKF